MRIPLSAPDITDAEIEAVTAVMRSNTLSLGPKLVEFESAIAAFVEVPYAIAVSSGTAGLHLALEALGIGEGDEVIIPSFTFIAVANTVLYQRAKAVFVDIDPVTLNIDPASVEAGISPLTKAIVVVHTFGVPADMDALMNLARKHNLKVIEDACEAIGGTYKGRQVGSLGDISVFAFYPNKQITTGEGGVVLTRNNQIADRIRALRNQGRYSSADWLQHAEIGFNYRLSEIACAMGIVQLQRLPEILQQRATVARNYDALLAPISGIELPQQRLESRSISWFVYVIRLADHYPPETRDQVLISLTAQGIGCGRYFAPIHLQPAYREVPNAQHAVLPVTEFIAQRTLALPFFNRLSTPQAQTVANAVAVAINDCNERLDSKGSLAEA
jgi:perosamine synthetase